MRGILKWTLRILGFLAIVAIGIGLWKREEIARLMAVNTLFASEHIVENFSNMNSAFLHTPVPRGDGPVMPLPPGDPITLTEGTLDWIEDRAVTSLLVLHQGEVVHESYHLETAPDDRRISWSVAKSFLSALMGVVVNEDYIASLDDPVTQYAPELKDSAYDGATIRNVLQMTSGVRFDEDYTDYDSDINRMGRVLALGGSMDGFAAGLDAPDTPPANAGNTSQSTRMSLAWSFAVPRAATSPRFCRKRSSRRSGSSPSPTISPTAKASPSCSAAST